MILLVADDIAKFDAGMTIKHLVRGLKLDLPSEVADIKISGLTDDSRKVNHGDLFLAIPGNSIDGRNYINEAASLGASAILTTTGKKFDATIPIIYVENIRNVVAVIASQFFGQPSAKMKVAGITGTNGKTTVTFMLARIFESLGKKWGKIGTIGYYIGDQLIPSSNTTPGSVELQRHLAEMVKIGLDGCAMEVSSHALDQNRCDSVQFASATFTNLTQDHLDYHPNMEAYFIAKARLFENAPVSIVNIDDQYGVKLHNRLTSKCITYGTDSQADLHFESIKADVNRSLLKFKYQGQTAELDLHLPGWFNHQNAAAAIGTAIGLGVPFAQAVNGLSQAPSVPGRLQPVKMGQPFGVYVDYAHTPDALEKLLMSLRRFNPKRLIVVFGCGGDRDKKKRPLMGEVVSKNADVAFVTSDNPRSEEPSAILKDIVKGITDKKKCQVIEDRSQAIKAALSVAGAGDIVVIAGKGHEEYQIVGNVRKYFSDIEVSKSALKKLGYASND